MIVNFKQAGWKKYIKQIEKLVEKIACDDYQVDHIICLARGGMLPGDIVSRVLKKPLSVCKVSSYNIDHQQDDVVHIQSITGEQNISGNVLLVDDLCDSGRTLKEMSQYVANHFYNVKEVRSAVIWFKNKGVDNLVIPDYVVHDIDEKDWVWIVQPMETYEDITVEQLREKSNK